MAYMIKSRDFKTHAFIMTAILSSYNASFKPAKAHTKKSSLYYKILAKYPFKVPQLVILSATEYNRVNLNTKQTAVQQNRRAKPTETLGNRAVMRDGYQRHPATNTHQCTWAMKNTHASLYIHT